MMDLQIFGQLLSPLGQDTLAAVMEMNPSEASLLSCCKRLQKRFPADLVRAALTTALLRQKASAKFSLAAEMFFTSEALEQSSSQIISEYRSRRFRFHSRVADFGCSIGGDTIGLAGVTHITAFDIDPLRLAMAKENVSVYKRRDCVEFRQTDLTARLPVAADAYFFDPARRSHGKRFLSVKNYQPPLELTDEWNKHTQGGGVKIAPGVPVVELEHFLCELEFISLDGKLKECVLWFGSLRTGNERCATLLPGGAQLHGSATGPTPVVSQPSTFLYDPDPAVIRAGLVTTLAERLNAFQIDESIAYLTSSESVDTPFAKRYEIDLAAPFHLKKLRRHLRQRNVGQAMIKRRGSPIHPEELRRQLKLSGDEQCVVFLTRSAGKPFMLVGKSIERE